MRNLWIKVIFVAVVFIFGGSWVLDGAVAHGEVLGGNSHVQLNPIMTPTRPLPGSFLGQSYPLTPVMTVPKAEDVAFVCRRAPRVAEAILRYFQQYPVSLTPQHRLDLKAINKNNVKIAAYVNRALGQNAVSKVYLTDVVAKSMARGTMERLPFAKIQGCSRVLKEYEERMKKLEGEKK